MTQANSTEKAYYYVEKVNGEIGMMHAGIVDSAGILQVNPVTNRRLADGRDIPKDGIITELRFRVTLENYQTEIKRRKAELSNTQ